MQYRQWNDNRQRELEQTYYDDSELQCRHSGTHLWDFSGGSSPERSTNAEEDELQKEQRKAAFMVAYEKRNVEGFGMQAKRKYFI